MTELKFINTWTELTYPTSFETRIIHDELHSQYLLNQIEFYDFPQKSAKELDLWADKLLNISQNKSHLIKSIQWNCNCNCDNVDIILQLLGIFYHIWHSQYEKRLLMINLLRRLDCNLLEIPLRTIWLSCVGSKFAYDKFVIDTILLVDDSFPNLNWDWDFDKPTGPLWENIVFIRQWRESYHFRKSASKYRITYALSPNFYPKYQRNIFHRIFWDTLFSQDWVEYEQVEYGSNTADLLFLTTANEEIHVLYLDKPKIVLDFNNQEHIVYHRKTIILNFSLEQVNFQCFENKINLPLGINLYFWRKYCELQRSVLHPYKVEVGGNNCFHLGDIHKLNYYESGNFSTEISSCSSLEWFLGNGSFHIKRVQTQYDKLIALLNNPQYKQSNWLKSQSQIVFIILAITLGYKVDDICQWKWLLNTEAPITNQSSGWIPIESIVWSNEKLNEKWVYPQLWNTIWKLKTPDIRSNLLVFNWYNLYGCHQGAYPRVIGGVEPDLFFAIPNFLPEFDWFAMTLKRYLEFHFGINVSIVLYKQLNTLLLQYPNVRVINCVWEEPIPSHFNRSKYITAILDDKWFNNNVSHTNFMRIINQTSNLYVSSCESIVQYYSGKYKTSNCLSKLVYPVLDIEQVFQPNSYTKVIYGWIGNSTLRQPGVSLVFDCNYNNLNELPDFLNKINIILSDSSSNSILIALQCGKPFISSRKGIVIDIEIFCQRRNIEFPGWILDESSFEEINNIVNQAEIKRKGKIAKLCWDSHWNTSFGMLRWCQSLHIHPLLEVSLLISYYKVPEKYLKECLNSVIEQIGLGFCFSLEVILLNNGNTESENHKELIAMYHHQLNELTNGRVLINMVSFSKKVQKSYVLNYGIKQSKYDCIMRLEPEDQMTDYRIYSQALQMYQDKKNKRQVLRGGQICWVNSNGSYIEDKQYDCTPKRITNIEELKFYKHQVINPSSIGFWKKDVLDLGGYNSNDGLEDNELCLSALKNGFIIENVEQNYVWNRNTK